MRMGTVFLAVLLLSIGMEVDAQTLKCRDANGKITSASQACADSGLMTRSF